LLRRLEEIVDARLAIQNHVSKKGPEHANKEGIAGPQRRTSIGGLRLSLGGLLHTGYRLRWNGFGRDNQQYTQDQRRY